jgi:hypothetical protein
MPVAVCSSERLTGGLDNVHCGRASASPSGQWPVALSVVLDLISELPISLLVPVLCAQVSRE